MALDIYLRVTFYLLRPLVGGHRFSRALPDLPPWALK
jgi:hypothetical protein